MSTRRKEERPGELLEAAFEEFSQKGFAATRLDDIAARANVTKGTIYVYFTNKEQLFETMVRELMSPAIEEVEALEALESGSAVTILRSFLRSAYDMIARDRRKRELMRLLILEAERFPELTHEHYTQFVAPILRKLGDYMASLAERGEIRQMPVLAYPEILIGPAVALNIWRLLFVDAPAVDTELHFEAVLDLFLHGILPRPPEP